MSYHFLCKRGIHPVRTEQFLVRFLIISYAYVSMCPSVFQLVSDLPDRDGGAIYTGALSQYHMYRNTFLFGTTKSALSLCGVSIYIALTKLNQQYSNSSYNLDCVELPWCCVLPSSLADA